MERPSLEFLTDKIDELSQQKKRYHSALIYLSKKAQEQLEKENNNIEAEVLALEIIKVAKDTLTGYEFKLD